MISTGTCANSKSDTPPRGPASANRTEISRADTKAVVLLGVIGTVLGTFITAPRSTETLRWSGVVTSLLAIVCFVCAIAPRRRSGRRHSTAGPGYFEHITPGMGIDSLNRAFEHAAHDPTGPLLLSLQGTSEIIRAKYRWVETGAVLLMAALPQFAVSLHA